MLGQKSNFGSTALCRNVISNIAYQWLSLLRKDNNTAFQPLMSNHSPSIFLQHGIYYQSTNPSITSIAGLHQRL